MTCHGQPVRIEPVSEYLAFKPNQAMICFNGKSLRFFSLLVTLYEKFTYEKTLSRKLDLVAPLVTDPPGSSCTNLQ